MKILQYLKDFIALFYPRVCSGCGETLQQKETELCLFCLVKLPRIQYLKKHNTAINNLFAGRVPLHYTDAWLFFRKKGIAQKLMHEIKYNGHKSLAQYLGYLYGNELVEKIEKNSLDLITSVPLHPVKLKQRGYNQSDAIAKGFANALNLPFNSDLLFKKINKKSQTQLKRYDRWENASESFKMNTNISIKNKHIGIVDDVITTGATLQACAEELLNSGACTVSVFSLCLAIN